MLQHHGNDHGQATLVYNLLTVLRICHGAPLESMNINSFHWHHIDLCHFSFVVCKISKKTLVELYFEEENLVYRCSSNPVTAVESQKVTKKEVLSALDVGYINVDSATASMSILCHR